MLIEVDWWTEKIMERHESCFASRFERAFGSIMINKGVPDSIVDFLLGHKIGPLAEAYKKVQFDHFFRDYPDYGTHKAGYCINAGLEWLLNWMSTVQFRRSGNWLFERYEISPG
jgi:hypothetical protein